MPGGLSHVSLFRKMSIDSLIASCEDPEKKLKRTLGAWSLTSLGIGAVIGAGIFTVIGTAIAGQKFDTSSILNAPLLDYLIHHSATFGRPGAGPALAVSLLLVAGGFGLSAPLFFRTGPLDSHFGRADHHPPPPHWGNGGGGIWGGAH